MCNMLYINILQTLGEADRIHSNKRVNSDSRKWGTVNRMWNGENR